MRWNLLFAWAVGSIPIIFLVACDDFVSRAFMGVGALLCILACMAFAQQDGIQRREHSNGN
ncbi:MAG TPA: hypothetical protein VFW94_23445 [Candidatus Acidoferrales bacterium]|nr:hypothetical protein [Candidatus Acidoferrales bacterium]